MRNTYTVSNDNDANDYFVVEGKDTEDAALAALEILGWNISKTEETED
jgi:hypothetical protein